MFDIFQKYIDNIGIKTKFTISKKKVSCGGIWSSNLCVFSPTLPFSIWYQLIFENLIVLNHFPQGIISHSLNVNEPNCYSCAKKV